MTLINTLIATSAVAFSSPDAVTTRTVEFTHQGDKMVGTLYIPAGPPTRRPAVVVTGAWMTVQEQMPGRYARELADRGLVAFTFDFRGWGRSGGKRRQFEDPAMKISDILAAVRKLKTLPEVDAKRVGGLGICASAGHMVNAASQTKDLKSVAVVAPWLQDPEIVEATYGGKSGVDALIKVGREAEAKYRETGKPEMRLAASLADKSAVMYGVPYYTEKDRGMIPQWRNEVDLGFWEGWLTFNPMAVAAKLDQPFMMVHSEAAAIPQGAHRFYGQVRGPKEELWLPQVGQLDFYDRAEPVRRAADAVSGHFARTLSTSAAAGLTQKVQGFLGALEAMDMTRFVGLWAKDAVQEMPYAPGQFPKRWEGRDTIAANYRMLPGLFASMKFDLRRIAAVDQPGTVLAEYDGDIKLKSGQSYTNRYVGLFRFDSSGKLNHYTEYFDPFTLVRDFPGAAALGATDEDQILQKIQLLARQVDGRSWEALPSLFSEQVDVDYSSVGGGAPNKVAREALVAGWKSGLGAFTRTKHNFSDVTVTVDGALASVGFTGQATHWKKDGTLWSCGGSYVAQLVRAGSGWRIASIQFNMEWEQGSRQG